MTKWEKIFATWSTDNGVLFLMYDKLLKIGQKKTILESRLNIKMINLRKTSAKKKEKKKNKCKCLFTIWKELGLVHNRNAN